MKRKTKIIIILSALLALLAILASVYVFAVYLPEKREQKELLAAIEAYYKEKLETYAEENEKYADREIDVAFLGDSLTDGYDLKTYYPDYTVANRGIGGETSHGLLERMQVSLYELQPKVAVVLIGGNNLKTMLESYESILIGIKENAPETNVVLCSLTAMGGSFKEKNEISSYNNVYIKKLAQKYGFEFVDLFTPLFDETTGEIYSSYTSDGVHLTPDGYEVLTEAITPAIEAALAKNN